MFTIQSMLHAIEAGKGQFLLRIIPFFTILFVICAAYNKWGYAGLDDMQSMDNAQLARQISRGAGLNTEFLRPFAVAQLRDYNLKKKLELFPASKFPAGVTRTIPDTYNAPVYPYVLGYWFKLIRPQFDQDPQDMAKAGMYSGDRWIPVLNQIFMLLTAFLVFRLGLYLFDDRVAWFSLIAFLGTDLVWQYTVTGLSTNLLMFLVTAFLFACMKIFSVGEACFESNEEVFWPAWIWTLVASALLAVVCLTRLHLVIMLIPLLVFLALIPRTSMFLLPVAAIVVVGLVTPWLLHMYNISGNIMGANAPQLLYGEDPYKGNQIFCSTSIPNYEQLLKQLSKKEFLGFRWHFEHAWEMLGSNPAVLLFAASILHHFKRRRTNAFRWMIIGSAMCIIAANNAGVAHPGNVDAWNTLVALLPAMIVVGSAFFFILLDRLDLHLWLLNNAVVALTLGLTLMPLALSLVNSKGRFPYPPYYCFFITQTAQMAHPDEWVTSDMPWATAWYGDRASLWLPDSIKDFYTFHDDDCPTGILLLTPVTLDGPMTNLLLGEYKDWYPVFPAFNPPPEFPLKAHTTFPNALPAYYIWSNDERWAVKQSH